MLIDRRSWTVALAISTVLATTVACGESGAGPEHSITAGPPSTSSIATADVVTLPTGKDDLALPAGRYRSPDGFYPPLVVTVDDSWTSVHRGADGFDLGRSTGPDGALLIAVAFLVPSQSSATAALDAVRNRIPRALPAITATVGGLAADGVDVDGGSGELVSGSSGGIALDALPGGRVRVLAVDVNGSPLVVAVVVPELARWDELWPDVETVLQGVEFS